MKKIIIPVIASVAMMLASSCQKSPLDGNFGTGYLNLSDLTISQDESVDTKNAKAADLDYHITIIDAEDNVVLTRSYQEISEEGGKLSLASGEYTLVARSTDKEVPASVFETPIYGIEKQFTISAGHVTSLGQLTCTLVQCKVTIEYSAEFLESVTGPGSTKVSVTAGHPLEYQLNADGSFDQRAGYFAVNGTTMEVVFSGSIEGKSQKMTKTFNNIAPRQWRKIKFVKKTNAQGNATFDIEINPLVSDAILNNSVAVEQEEPVIGTDPRAPKDDGGIRILDNGCDDTITFSETDIVLDPVTGEQINSTGLINIPIAPLSSPMSIKLKAVVPSGIQKFTVDISTDNNAFAAAVAAAEATHLDLVNPLEANMIIFSVVPFPYGPELIGETEKAFDISAAQEPILAYKGNHVFLLTIVDTNGKKKVTKVTMVVE